MTTQNDCSRHSWLVPPGEEGGQTCQHCADDAETARVLAGPARTYTAEDMRDAFIAGYLTDRGIEDVERPDVAKRDAERANRAASTYVARL